MIGGFGRFLAAALLSCMSVTIASAQEVRVGFKDSKAPYVLATKPYAPTDYDARRAIGIEVEIWHRVLAGLGLTLVPRYMSYELMATQIAEGRIDAAASLPTGVDSVHYLGGILRLHNHVIVDGGADNPLTTLKDMSGMRVVAFANASEWLGNGFRAAIPEFASYRELSDHQRQVRFLASRRADALVSDLGIFRHYAKLAGEDPARFAYYPLLGGAIYSGGGFRSAILRATFEISLNQLKQAGAYEAIYRRYLD